MGFPISFVPGRSIGYEVKLEDLRASIAWQRFRIVQEFCDDVLGTAAFDKYKVTQPGEFYKLRVFQVLSYQASIRRGSHRIVFARQD